MYGSFEPTCLMTFLVVLDWRLLSINFYVVEGCIMKLAFLDAVVSSRLTCFRPNEQYGRQKQKAFADTLTLHVNEAVTLLTQQVRKLVRIWKLRMLELPSESTDSFLKMVRKRNILYQWRRATSAVFRSVCNFLIVERRCFKTYLKEELGGIHGCYIAEITE